MRRPLIQDRTVLSVMFSRRANSRWLQPIVCSSSLTSLDGSSDMLHSTTAARSRARPENGSMFKDIIVAISFAIFVGGFAGALISIAAPSAPLAVTYHPRLSETAQVK
jgi:hypothetical protein